MMTTHKLRRPLLVAGALAAFAGTAFLVVGRSGDDRAGLIVPNPEDRHAPPSSPSATRHVGSSPDGVLAEKPRPSPVPNPAERVRAMVETLVAVNGAEAAMNQIANDRSRRPNERLAAAESVGAIWAKDDPDRAYQWLRNNSGQAGQPEDNVEFELFEAALSGYIEGVAEYDPEAAARLAVYLEPQTRLPAANPLNRSTPTVSDAPGSIVDLAEAAPPSSEVPPPPSAPTAENVASVDSAVTAPPITETVDPFSPLVRDANFPGDPGFPGDPDFLTPKSE